MSGIATAVVASAVIGGAVANKGANDAIDAQKDQNASNEAFIKEQAAKARSDSIPLYDASRGALRDGTQAGLNTLGTAMGQQIDTSARGNYFAQEQMLAGLPQVQNAILGMPVDMGALQPKILHPERNLDSMINPQMADQRMPDLAASLGGVTDPNNPLGITPGMTNKEVVSYALDQGAIGPGQYELFQQNFKDAPGVADGTAWGSAGSAGNLINQIGPETNAGWRSTLEQLFNGIYPNNGAR